MDDEHPLADPLALSQAVCARICHDLGSVIGGLSGALELLDEPSGEAPELAREVAQTLERRLSFWRAAAGYAEEDLDLPSLAKLIEGVTIGRRHLVSLDAMPLTVTVPGHLVQPLLLATLLATEALPRGGTVHLDRRPTAFAIRPEGERVVWPPSLTRVLAGEALTPGPRNLPAVLLARFAEARRASVALADTGEPGRTGTLLLGMAKEEP